MSVRKGQARLRKIATQIFSNAPLSNEDQAFLVTALQTIADGGDADTALGVKAKKGERKSHYARNTDFNKQLFLRLDKGSHSRRNRRWIRAFVKRCSPESATRLAQPTLGRDTYSSVERRPKRTAGKVHNQNGLK